LTTFRSHNKAYCLFGVKRRVSETDPAFPGEVVNQKRGSDSDKTLQNTHTLSVWLTRQQPKTKTKAKTPAPKTKTKTETEAPKHKHNVNIIESQIFEINAVMYHE